jgi:ABC-type phosphate transport system substrate-binding protein
MNWIVKSSKYLAAACCFTLAFEASAGIAIVVNPAAKISAVDASLAKDIFLGKSSSLPNGQKVVAIDQEPGPSRDEFLEKLIKKSDSQLKAYWAQLVFTGRGQPPKQVMDDMEVKELVAENPNMMGYIHTDEVDATVKVLLTID